MLPVASSRPIKSHVESMGCEPLATFVFSPRVRVIFEILLLPGILLILLGILLPGILLILLGILLPSILLILLGILLPSILLILLGILLLGILLILLLPLELHRNSLSRRVHILFLFACRGLLILHVQGVAGHLSCNRMCFVILALCF